MPRKPKTPQAGSPDEVSGRDLFQTPNYAVDLLVPFIQNIYPQRPGFMIWEPACGLEKIVHRLVYHNFNVFATDLQTGHNFLEYKPDVPKDVIITNPPFSIKKKFYERCLYWYEKYGVPFALLIPSDYSSWVIDAMKKGAEKIVPTRRIDFITPNTLQRIHEGEIWEQYVHPHYPNYKTLKAFMFDCRSLWDALEFKYRDYHNYETIYDAPPKLLRKYSSSYYHSMWLTMGFNIGKQETFVELTNEMKDNI